MTHDKDLPPVTVPRWSFSYPAERRVRGRAGGREHRELLMAQALGVCHLLGERVNACSCCPAPCSIMSQSSSPGYRSAADSGCSLTSVFGYLPGSREARS